MAKIVLGPFKGMIPKIDERNLSRIDNNLSVTCTNVDLKRGTLAPVKGITVEEADLGAGPLRSMYWQTDRWITWANVVDVVKAEIADSDHRIFFTGSGYPKQTNYTLQTAGTQRRLGVVPPTTALTITKYGTGNGVTAQSVSYVYTYVDEFGEESVPNTATAVVAAQEGEYIGLSGFVVPDTSNGNSIQYLRLYRLESDGSGSADYQLIGARPGMTDTAQVQDIPVAEIVDTNTVVYDANDRTAPDALTQNVYETLPSENWDRPSDTAENLVQFSNGILALSDGNEVFVSESLVPYAYPTGYGQVVQDDIVGLGVFRESLFVLTTDRPSALHGTDPSTMFLERLQHRQACLSKRGILSTDAGVLYPSPDGLFLMDNTQGLLVTDHLIKREQWMDEYSPSSLLTFEYENRIYGFTIGSNSGFILDVQNPEYIQSFEVPSKYEIYDAFYIGTQDKFYLLVKDTELGVYQIISIYTNAEYTDYTWKSAVFTFHNGPLSFSCGRVLGDLENGVQIKIFADGTLIQEETIFSERIFRTTPGQRAREWQVELSGSATVSRFILATSVQEILNVSEA